MGKDLSTQSNTAKQIGALGSLIVSGGVSYTGSAFSVSALADTTFNSLQSSKNNTFNDFFGGTGQALSAGIALFSDFTVVDVNSGAVMVYEQ